jgi:SAM-dependent methyltransferase
MNQFQHGLARSLVETFDIPEPILELGSYQVEGQDEYSDLRSLFPGKHYVGLDMRPGPGVDVVGNVDQLPQPDGSVGTVIALNLFEHVTCFWRGFAEIERVLRPDGVLFVSCPFHCHIHNYPGDYWRFTPMALRWLLQSYPSKILGWHGPPSSPLNVWSFAARPQFPPISDEQFTRYRTLLARYGRQPVRRTKWLRYLLGSWLCGRRPFAAWLDRERWESVCLNDSAPPSSAWEHECPAQLASTF